MVVFRRKWFSSDNVAVIGQGGSTREKWLYWEKNNCNRAKVVVLGQSGCIRAKVVVFGQSGFIKATVAVIWQKLLYLGKRD